MKIERVFDLEINGTNHLLSRGELAELHGIIAQELALFIGGVDFAQPGTDVEVRVTNFEQVAQLDELKKNVEILTPVKPVESFDWETFVLDNRNTPRHKGESWGATMQAKLLKKGLRIKTSEILEVLSKHGLEPVSKVEAVSKKKVKAPKDWKELTDRIIENSTKELSLDALHNKLTLLHRIEGLTKEEVQRYLDSKKLDSPLACLMSIDIKDSDPTRLISFVDDLWHERPFAVATAGWMPRDVTFATLIMQTLRDGDQLEKLVHLTNLEIKELEMEIQAKWLKKVGK